MNEVRSFPYTIGGPLTTEMIVARGILADPSKFDIIPEKSKTSPIFVFTDETVGGLYGEHFAESLREQGYDVHLLVFPDGEETKTIETYVPTVEKVIAIGPDEGSVFISVGGGVICNLCGFVASTIYRGLTLIHVPTSLMAQCDAAISHKQALNGKLGKNLIGSYYSPVSVFVDPEALRTLDERLVRDGMSEVIKHALCHSQEFVDLLLEAPENFWEDAAFMEKCLILNIEHKCLLASNDPKEDAEAVILLYGHATGHAIEFNADDLFHGEAVAIGMVVSARIAELMGICSKELVDLHIELCEKFRLPTKIPSEVDLDTFLRGCRYDKKFLAGTVRMGLVADVGVLHTIDGDYLIPTSTELLTEAFHLTRED